MNPFKTLVPILADDANGMNNGLGPTESRPQEFRAGDVPREKFDPCRKLGSSCPGDGPNGQAFGRQDATNFPPDKAGSTCYDNHMSPMLEEVVINTRSHTEFVPLAQFLEEAAARRGWREGLLHVVIPHTTAGVTIQEGADPDVRRDMAVAFEKAVPWESRDYRHGEGNTAAHVKAAMVGNHLAWPIEKGRLKFGTWQMIYFCEFDGPRTRRAWVGFQPLSAEPQSRIS
jgi:secondary thiamine-phosphate synthase enzyme